MHNSSVSVTANPISFGEGVGSGLSSKSKACGEQTRRVSFVHDWADEHFLCTEYISSCFLICDTGLLWSVDAFGEGQL